VRSCFPLPVAPTPLVAEVKVNPVLARTASPPMDTGVREVASTCFSSEDRTKSWLSPHGLTSPGEGQTFLIAQNHAPHQVFLSKVALRMPPRPLGGGRERRYGPAGRRPGGKETRVGPGGAQGPSPVRTAVLFPVRGPPSPPWRGEEFTAGEARVALTQVRTTSYRRYGTACHSATRRKA
jgi:hypothetical protein